MAQQFHCTRRWRSGEEYVILAPRLHREWGFTLCQFIYLHNLGLWKYHYTMWGHLVSKAEVWQLAHEGESPCQQKGLYRIVHKNTGVTLYSRSPGKQPLAPIWASLQSLTLSVNPSYKSVLTSVPYNFPSFPIQRDRCPLDTEYWLRIR